MTCISGTQEFREQLESGLLTLLRMKLGRINVVSAHTRGDLVGPIADRTQNQRRIFGDCVVRVVEVEPLSEGTGAPGRSLCFAFQAVPTHVRDLQAWRAG